MRGKKPGIILMALLLCTLFAGCIPQSPEELYQLPKQSEEYYNLQNQIESVLDSGAEYCAPVSGDRRQAVQLADLNSDGVEEAIVFFRMPGEKPLKIYIYQKNQEGYEEAAVIEGDGSAFESVDYRQIDTTLGLELVVGRQVSDQVPQTLSVYSLEGSHVTELLNVSCIRHTVADLDSNGLQELLVFRSEENSQVGLTEYYAWGDSGLECEGSAAMSTALGSDSIRRIIRGMMQENTPAVFVANTYEENTIVTDVFILKDGAFLNVSALGESANDATRVRYRNVYSEDIDDDGLLELPTSVRLPKRQEEDTVPYYKIRWYNLRTDGTREYKQSTFHNYTDGWYVDLLPQWEESLAVDYAQDEQGLAGYWFYGEEDALFSVLALTGADARELAGTDGRFILAEKGDVVYAARIYHETVTQDQLQSAFHFIFTDWNSGEV